jgi:hypothetical protein
MNEYIEVAFSRNGKALKLKRQLPDGRVELAEPDPISRRITIGLTPRDEVTRYRTRRMQQLRGWALGEFRLKVSVEAGVLVIRGDDPEALPEGRYQIRLELEEAKTKVRTSTVVVDQDEYGECTVEVTTDDRQVEVDLEDCDDEIRRVIDASEVDGLPAAEWLEDADVRPSRKACLLNLLASLRVRPTLTDPLIELIERFYQVQNDRVYARVGIELLTRLDALSLDPKRPFYREGRPTASIHQQLVATIPSVDQGFFSTDRMVSFRGEGSPSLQAVLAEPAAGGSCAYADLDLDLGNALQDVVGFVVHMGELVSGKQTNHLDLRRPLASKKAKTRNFLYYTIVDPD